MLLNGTVSWLRNHTGVLLSMLCVCILFCGGVVGCDLFLKTDSTLTPGKKVNATELQTEAAIEQKTVNDGLVDLDAKYKLLANQATAFNVEQAAAQADLAQKQAAVKQVISTLGGAVTAMAGGTFNPLTLLQTIPTLAIGALGIGSMVDKKQLQSVVAAQRSQLATSAAPTLTQTTTVSGPVALPVADTQSTAQPAPSPYVIGAAQQRPAA